ncbi:MAG: hypothetical protein ABUL60_18470 [Myxococcales bacterium]
MRIDAILPNAALWLVAAATCALSGCPGELSNKADFEAYAATHGDAGAPTNEAGTSAVTAGSASTSGCGDVVTRIFVPTCSGTGCHGATAPQQDLDLVSPGLAARVVGVQAKQCLQVLVDPANPEQSLMYQKLLTKPACGAQMPLARPALSGADISCVRDWIAAQ